MKANIVPWTEIKPGDHVLVQGTMMTVVKEVETDEETRLLEVKYKKHEMEVRVFKTYLTAVEDAG